MRKKVTRILGAIAGALLCMLMEKLEVPGWQEELNSQTAENPLTLYAQIEKFVEVQGKDSK